MSRSATALLGACHPGPTVAVTVLATSLAVAAGATAGTAALVLATVLAGQLSIGWSNDLLDRERDAASGRTDKPVATGALPAGTVRTAAGVALLSTAGLSPLAGLPAGAAHLGVVACGWAYNLGLKRVPASVLPYAVAFGLLPAYAVLALPGDSQPAGWLVAAGALLGSGAHFFNVLPDLEDDRATGVRSLPVALGAARSRLVGSALLVAAAAAVVLGQPGAPSGPALAGLVAATALAAAAAFPRRDPRSRTPFLLAVLAAALDLVLLVVLLDPATAVR